MNPYLSSAVLTSFDGENQGGQPADPTPLAAPDGFVSQEKLNQILADDRRKHFAKTAAKTAAVEKAMSDLLESKNLTEQQREHLEQQVEELRAASRTKEEQLEHQKRQVEETAKKRISDAEKQAKNWETMYKDGLVEQSLKDAATHHEALPSM